MLHCRVLAPSASFPTATVPFLPIFQVQFHVRLSGYTTDLAPSVSVLIFSKLSSTYKLIFYCFVSRTKHHNATRHIEQGEIDLYFR